MLRHVFNSQYFDLMFKERLKNQDFVSTKYGNYRCNIYSSLKNRFPDLPVTKIYLAMFI
jgi:hypothetical protein